jgi:hypothetical protein
MMIEIGSPGVRSPYIENERTDWKLGREGEGFESPPSPPVSLLCVRSSGTLCGLADWRTGEGVLHGN